MRLELIFDFLTCDIDNLKSYYINKWRFLNEIV
jgi:hypothetical protein